MSLLSNSGRYGHSAAALNGCLPVVSQLFQSNHSNQSGGFNHHSAHHHHPHPGMHFTNSHFGNNPLGNSSLSAHNSLGMNLKSTGGAGGGGAAADPNNNSMDVEKLDLNRSSPRTTSSTPNKECVEKVTSGENNHHEGILGDQRNHSPSKWRRVILFFFFMSILTVFCSPRHLVSQSGEWPQGGGEGEYCWRG